MKTNRIKIYLLLLVLVAGFTQSCTDGFEDMNKDPKNPTQTSMPSLFNKIISTLPLVGQEITAVHHGVYYFQTQQLANAKPEYPMASGSNDLWNNYYYNLKNIHLLYQELDAYQTDLKKDNAKACIDILLAYKTLHMLDYFGDMPFFNAGQGLYGTAYYMVAYDKQEEVYKHCIDLMKQASQALSTATGDQYSFSSGDTFLKGDISKWKKFANSILLRYGMQLADADAAYTTLVGELLGDSGKYPMLSGTDIIGLWPKDLANTLFENHPWSYRENNTSCLGTTMWKAMSDNDNVDGSGIFDPRCFVFFEPNNDGEWKAHPQNGTPASGEGQGLGPYFNQNYPTGRGKGATEQEWNNKTEACRFSPVNFYLASNEDYIPEIMVTAAEVHFLRAEAYTRGIGVSKNTATAETEYEAGIKSSLHFWYDKVVEPCAQWIFYKPTLTSEQETTYLKREAFSSNDATALKQIYKQMWIDSFRQPWVSFNLYRRTLNTPRDESGTYNSADYNFHKVPYPESEKNYNLDNFNKATDGGNNATDKKLFWHK
ncbi:hypothetical protein M2459_000040 [Parabacteroides sp. PF5-5]|uniref:SusD/RagB family nutrient-binding outer membrane lipoprotein n=1 Tax=unclassified Parabacteroides TaxID=2649774 RepID=UPI002474ABE2|nr:MULTISPECIES: SusD/RagB family nutrient-binding outer membrane lipoprotein [unclassified Parabacteroides]MDH6303708.1 hypothetical protein [Parabacteroides sp. PH5-39]MDH6314325.1 hypothetical protein [Parabacteroides sp. PF5-13]MDH6318611.1 hypothetical protein [Parabacteroides sp. PH5-13]MDH6322097.1 hypothetical protein [Parabacteroides sp. PH5-8]MDH6325824.1 hypothetical protein [Parabacteroides sp. PH5-41]